MVDARQEIREVLDRQIAGMRKGDVEDLVARFTPDAALYSLAPPLRQADPRDATGLAAWFATFDGPVDYDITELEIETGGDVAYAHGLARLTATPQGSSEPFTLWFRLTSGLRKVDGEWRVTHEHQSVPFHMDGSFAAAVELRP
jgi:ketosteroid isomerase-like protein